MQYGITEYAVHDLNWYTWIEYIHNHSKYDIEAFYLWAIMCEGSHTFPNRLVGLLGRLILLNLKLAGRLAGQAYIPEDKLKEVVRVLLGRHTFLRSQTGWLAGWAGIHSGGQTQGGGAGAVRLQPGSPCCRAARRAGKR
jgi:hypothetical protein